MKKKWCLLLLLVFSQKLLAQYTLNGNAQQVSCNCYNITSETTNQSGSIWNNNRIDLTQSFDFKFDINLGRLDANGADGIAFVLQPISTSVGSTGGGLGYENITPAVGITVDTYQNGNNSDPAYDHISIQLNGDLNHSSPNNIAGPVTALSGNDNIEDGLNHSMRIQWDAAAKTLSTYMDGVLRVTAVKDLVNDVFGGNPLVFWGFTGGTGALVNAQKFCTALNPGFHLAPDQKTCVGEPITFFDSTVSFTNIAKFYWDFGDGSPLDSVHTNPVHIYTTGGEYTIILKVIGADGCEATTGHVITVGTKPVAAIRLPLDYQTCLPNQFFDSSYADFGTINKWFWDLDDGQTSTLQNPYSGTFYYGYKNIRLAVSSKEGCASDTVVRIILRQKTFADFDFTDSVCLGQPTSFYDKSYVLPFGSVQAWSWRLDDQVINTQNLSYTFLTPGIHTVMLITGNASLSNCLGFEIKNVFVVDKPHAAMKQNKTCINVPITLEDSSYSTDGILVTGWWWDLGNGQFSTQRNPLASYITAGTKTIKHVVYNSRGCISDTMIQTIIIPEKPVAKFGYSTPVCSDLPIYFSDSSSATGRVVDKWSWIYNGIEWSTVKNPIRNLPAGLQTIKLVVSSEGCVSDTAFKTFLVNPSPDVTMQFKNSCKNTPVDFIAIDNSGTVTDWKWTFGDGGIENTKNAQHTYVANGDYNVKLYASAANGCYSDLLEKHIIIYGTDAFAGNDTIAGANQQIRLHASGGLSYNWSPANLLDDATSADPITILTATQIFKLKAFTPEGCESYDEVKINIYKGPDIYLPNAFTPNGDGLNDIFRGIPVGLKQFNYIMIYNRWGQKVFFTTDYRKGWDGKWNGQKVDNGVYVVIANGIDFRGNVINKKGTVMLIR
jgi:gliding motility-associated-like protein